MNNIAPPMAMTVFGAIVQIVPAYPGPVGASRLSRTIRLASPHPVMPHADGFVAPQLPFVSSGRKRHTVCPHCLETA